MNGDPYADYDKKPTDLFNADAFAATVGRGYIGVDTDGKIYVRIKDGKNHGMSGTVVEYSHKSGGFEIDFGDKLISQIHDSQVYEKRRTKKRFYAIDRLEGLTADDYHKLLQMMPESRRKEKLIARAVLLKLTENAPNPLPPLPSAENINAMYNQIQGIVNTIGQAMRGPTTGRIPSSGGTISEPLKYGDYKEIDELPHYKRTRNYPAERRKKK